MCDVQATAKCGMIYLKNHVSSVGGENNNAVDEVLNNKLLMCDLCHIKYDKC